MSFITFMFQHMLSVLLYENASKSMHLIYVVVVSQIELVVSRGQLIVGTSDDY